METGGVFCFSLRSSNINPKEKGKKESAFRGAGFCGCKLFDLKIFPLKDRKVEMKGITRKNFKRNPVGLELAETKDKPLSWLDFFLFKQFQFMFFVHIWDKELQLIILN